MTIQESERDVEQLLLEGKDIRQAYFSRLLMEARASLGSQARIALIYL